VAGTYTANIFAASTGGSALATSGNIVVGNVVATGATVTAPSTGTVGTAITATVTLTPSNATAYACLNNGSDILPRTQFTGTSVNLTPTTAGTDTVKIYAASTGGSALATSGNIVISAASAPSINGGVSPMMVLDASVASHVTSDTGFTTPQTTNGGEVSGWKDSTSNGYNYSASSAGTLVTNSQNGLNGILFTSSALNGPSALAGAVYTATQTGGNGLTMAFVFNAGAYNGAPYIFQCADAGFSERIGLRLDGYADDNDILVLTMNGYYQAASPSSGLCIVIVTFNPSTTVVNTYVNNLTPASQSGYQVSGGDALSITQLGLCGGGATPVTFYEVDIWNTLASGTGGTSPTGDIAAIMSYLNTKWG
jgi:hypothetical protein